MFMTISRRKLIAGTAFLAAGLATSSISFATQAGSITIEIDNPEAFKGLTARKLRAALMRAMRFRSELGMTVEAQFLAARIDDGAVTDLFASRGFKLGAGDVAFPGDMFFPGNMFFPGDMFKPDVKMPARQRDGATRALMMDIAKSTLGEGGEPNGLVFFVLVADAATTSAGLGVPTRPAG
jgi:hypothetical protein